VAFGKVSVPHLLDALTRLNLAPTDDGAVVRFRNGVFTKATGEITLRGTTDTSAFTATLKQEYSTSIVLTQAKKYGWQVKEVAAHKWEVIRR
jgi:hypothetical protein